MTTLADHFQTIRMQVSDGHVFCHPGWPKELPIDVPVSVIKAVNVRKGLSGRLLGGGTVILELITEGNVVVADLDRPDEAKRIIELAIEQSSA